MFIVYSVLCNYNHNLILQHFCHSEKKPTIIVIPIPKPPRPRQPLIHPSTFCLYKFVYWDILNKWHHTICRILKLASFTYYNVFKVHSCQSTSVHDSFLLRSIP